MTWLVDILVWLARALAAPAAARDAGRQDGRLDAQATVLEIKNAQEQVAARPSADRDTLLRRVRDDR